MRVKFRQLLCLLVTTTIVAGCAGIANESPKRIALFNGKDLSGWDGPSEWWTVEDGALTAESTAERPCQRTNYIVWTGGQPSDFEFECDFKISAAGNSGIHIRSERRPNHDMFGYQADMTGDGKLIGFIYHHKRGLVAERGSKVSINKEGKRKATPMDEGTDFLKHYKSGNWNHYRIVCVGDSITLFLNGVKMCDIVDLDPSTKKEHGYIGLQMHRGDPMKVQFKNLYLTPIKPIHPASTPES